MQPDYLDDNIMGEDELISDERWEQEDLNSDAEVHASKERMLTATKNDTGNIPRTLNIHRTRMTPNSKLEPVAESSKGLQLARKTIASTRSKKQLKGLYEAKPEGAALVKTSNSTLTIKYPEQDDNVLHKSDVANRTTLVQPHNLEFPWSNSLHERPSSTITKNYSEQGTSTKENRWQNWKANAPSEKDSKTPHQS